MYWLQRSSCAFKLVFIVVIFSSRLVMFHVSVYEVCLQVLGIETLNKMNININIKKEIKNEMGGYV